MTAHVIDARGLLCPQPVIELARALAAGHPVVLIQADDPAAGPDIAAFCRMRGHLLSESESPGTFVVQSASATGSAAARREPGPAS